MGDKDNNIILVRRQEYEENYTMSCSVRGDLQNKAILGYVSFFQNSYPWYAACHIPKDFDQIWIGNWLEHTRILQMHWQN